MVQCAKLQGQTFFRGQESQILVQQPLEVLGFYRKCYPGCNHAPCLPSSLTQEGDHLIHLGFAKAFPGITTAQKQLHPA